MVRKSGPVQRSARRVSSTFEWRLKAVPRYIESVGWTLNAFACGLPRRCARRLLPAKPYRRRPELRPECDCDSIRQATAALRLGGLTSFLTNIKKGIQQFVQQIQQTSQGWLKPKASSLTLGIATDRLRSKADLMLKNALLRQQLVVVARQLKRAQFTRWDRLLWVCLASRWQGLRQALLLIQPETVSALAA